MGARAHEAICARGKTRGVGRVCEGRGGKRGSACCAHLQGDGEGTNAVWRVGLELEALLQRGYSRSKIAELLLCEAELEPAVGKPRMRLR
jgi:hypothetical protein